MAEAGRSYRVEAMPLKPCLTCGTLTKGSYRPAHQPVNATGWRERPSPSSRNRLSRLLPVLGSRSETLAAVRGVGHEGRRTTRCVSTTARAWPMVGGTMRSTS
jgi:hypothetical protein